MAGLVPAIHTEGGAYVSGLSRGFLPCGMGYCAVLCDFYAMLLGNAPGGAEVMAGSGLGALPSVTASP